MEAEPEIEIKVTEETMKWGYVLMAPGRPSLEKQLDFLRNAGVSVDEEYPPVFRDRVVTGNTNPRKWLTEREVLVRGGLGSGNTVFVADYLCLGFGVADATWFVGEIHKVGGRLRVAGDEITADDVLAMADRFAKAQNKHHVRVSRGLEPKYLPGMKRPKRKPLPPSKAAKRPCVYRHYDAEERLLYVGACVNYDTRTRTHRAKSAWFGQIARSAVEFYPSMKEANKAENAAIWFEKPIHNVRRTVPEPQAFVEAAAKIVAISNPEAAEKIRKLKRAV